MADAMFEADAHDPDHWRFYGRRAFASECQRVMDDAKPAAMTIGDIQREAISRLKAKHFAIRSGAHP